MSRQSKSAVSFNETVDLEKAKIIRDNWDSLKDKVGNFKDMKNGYEKMAEEATLTIINNFINLREKTPEVFYSYGRGKKEGRLFGNPSLQSLNKIFRHTISAEFYDDVDIENCHPRIFSQLCDRKGLTHPSLNHYNENREWCLAEICRETKCDRDTAKSYMLSIMNGGTPEIESTNLEWLNKYYFECKLLRDSLLALTEFKHYLTYAKRRKDDFNPEGSAINNIFCKYENEMLQSVIKHCKSKGYKIGALCFDGLMLYKDTDRNNESFLKQLSAKVKEDTEFDMVFTIKEMKEGIDLNGYKLAESLIDNPDLGVEVEERYSSIKTEFELNYFKTWENGKYVDIQHKKTYSYNEMRDKFCHLKYTINKGIKIVQGGFIVRWFQDPDIRKYYSVVDYPFPLETPKDCYNLWRGCAIKQTKNDNPTQKEREDLKKLYNQILLLCNKDWKIYDYVISWIAHIFQYPGEKLNVCLLLKSLEGLGKEEGLFLIMERIIGKEYCCITQQVEEHVLGNFNKFIKGKVLIALNEMSRAIAIKYQEQIKDRITQTEGQITLKGNDVETELSFSNFMSFSNQEFPWVISASDRRFMAIDASSQDIPNDKYFEELRVINKDKRVLRLFYDEMMNIDLSKWSAKSSRPFTEFNNDLKSLSKPVELNFIIEFIEEQEKDVTILSKDLFAAFIAFLNKQNTVENKISITAQAFGIKVKNFKIPNYKTRKSNSTTICSFPIIGARQWLKDKFHSVPDEKEFEPQLSSLIKLKL